MSVALPATQSPGLCHNDEFQCQTDGFCIPDKWECDGHPDCEDGSDEHNSCPPITCRSNYFQCANKLCIPTSWLCDGSNDCRDMSDEQNCPTPPFTCPSGQWQCPTDQVCIDLDKVCNGQRDCPNGADESPICSELKKYHALYLIFRPHQRLLLSRMNRNYVVVYDLSVKNNQNVIQQQIK